MSRKVAKLATNYLDLSLDCAALLLPSGSLEYLNPAAVKAFKLDGPRARPSWAELWETSPERDRARAALHRAAAGESASFRAWLHMAGEEPRFLDTLLTPLGSAPEDARILAVSRDLTEAKLYAAALEDKSERYHLAAKATRDAIWDWDLITDQIDWGEATKETFGPEAGPDAGSVNWWKANLHPEDRDRVLTRLRDFLAGPDACWSDEYRFRDSSGGYREVVDRGYVVRDRHGAPVRMVGAMTDLSSLRRAEEELATLSARLKTMFETTTDGIVALDPSWRLQFMNKRAEELLRLRADDVGEDLWTLFPDLATSEFGRAFRAAMEDDGPSDLTAYYAPFSLWFTCRLFPSSDGLTVFFRDITRLKTYQRTIKSSEERLKMALKAGRVVTWERNEDSDVLRFSDNAEDILGFRTCTLQQFRDRAHVEDFDRARKAIRSGQAGRFRFLGPRDKQIWLRATSTVIEQDEARIILGTICDVTEQEAAQERLWKAANYDDLTGLPNRAFLHAHLRDALASGSPFALLLLDLDDFKDLNDSAGHDAGDAMLRETASRIQDVAGDRAFAARCGGDEFALIVRGGPPEEVRELTRRLLDRLREPLHYAEHKTFSCRASLGLAYAPYDGSDAPALLKAADLALYAAKAAGRNMALSYSPDMGSALQRKVSTAAHVRAALNEGRLIPYYQPKVCLRTGLIKGFEALARIRGGAGRVESAASFADALAYPDIASDVTEQIMERVVRDASAWTRAGVPFGHVAVNLGEPDFSGLKDIVAEIGVALKRADLPGSALQIEVTENVLLGRGERRTARTLERLKRLGASIAMDDFGTGFGSLSHLRRFPVDVVKIDRSFIKHKDREGAAIAAAIVGLGKSLDLETVAEGVEDKQQFDWLREIGCNAGQGYYFAKPMPGASVPDFIRTWRLPVGLTATSA